MRDFARKPYLATAVSIVLGGMWLGLPAVLLGQQKEQKAAGKVYEVDTQTSRVYVRVDPEGGGHAHGIMGRLVSGTVVFGAAEKAGELVFDMTSFDPDSV